MKIWFLILGVALVVRPFSAHSQQLFSEFKAGDSLEKLTRMFPFVRVDEDLIKIPNVINGRRLLQAYKNYHNKSDTIIVEQLLYAGNCKNLNILFGNLFGLKRAVILAFDPDRKSNRIVYAEEGDYIKGFEESRIDSLLFFHFKTQYSTNCLEEKTFSIFSFNLKNCFFYRAFNELSDIEYFENESFCSKGISYKTTYLLKREHNMERLSAIRITGNKKTIKHYYFKNNRFVL